MEQQRVRLETKDGIFRGEVVEAAQHRDDVPGKFMDEEQRAGALAKPTLPRRTPGPCAGRAVRSCSPGQAGCRSAARRRCRPLGRFAPSSPMRVPTRGRFWISFASNDLSQETVTQEGRKSSPELPLITAWPSGYPPETGCLRNYNPL